MPTDPLTVHKVLVPLDFSDPSLQALQYARRFAEPSKAELILLYVIEPVAYPAELGVVINLDADLAERALGELENCACSTWATIRPPAAWCAAASRMPRSSPRPRTNRRI